MNSNSLTSIPTRSALLEALRCLGVDGAAADAIAAETAKNRHEYRVRLALEAARSYVRKIPEYQGFDDFPHVVTWGALSVLAADIFGIGGTNGVRGDSSRRHPGLETLGKGRKLATDGSAYSAAVVGAFWEAAYELTGGRCHSVMVKAEFPSPGEAAYVSFVLRGNEESSGGEIFHDSKVVNSLWLLSIYREGLRRAAGLGGWRDDLPWGYEGSLEAWANAYNQLVIKLDADQVAAASKRYEQAAVLFGIVAAMEEHGQDATYYKDAACRWRDGHGWYGGERCFLIMCDQAKTTLDGVRGNALATRLRELASRLPAEKEQVATNLRNHACVVVHGDPEAYRAALEDFEYARSFLEE